MTIETRTVAEAEADTRLDRWFRRHFPQLTQGALQKMLRTGQIRVDGKRAEANTRLAPGQDVRIPPLPEGPAPAPDRKPVSAEDASALERMVIHADRSLLVLDKPHGLAVQGGPGITRNLDAMLDALRLGAEERPRLVHRLDRDTSGVLLLARTAASAAFLARAFRGREVAKTYWAVVVPDPAVAEGQIDLALAKQGGPRGERMQAVDDWREGARAITDFRTLDKAKGRCAWLELMPLTGRTHQLRVHCVEGLGTPILGDGKYGGAGAHLEGLPHALHLHARALRLPHPEGGVLEAAAPLPPHMKETFDFFGFEPPRTPPPRRLAAPPAAEATPRKDAPMPDAAPRPRRLRWLLIGLAVLLLLPAAGIAIFLASFDLNAEKPRIIGAVQAATGRTLTLDGPISLKLSLVPTVIAEGVALANAPGGSRPVMASIRRAEVELALLPLLSRQVAVRRLVLVGPDILLETDAEGRPNWAFTPAGAAPPPGGTPPGGSPPAPSSPGIAIGEVRVEDGMLRWHNGRTGLSRTLGIGRLTLAGGEGPLTLTGSLALDGTPITLAATTGPLAALFGAPPAEPWPLQARLEAAGARLAAAGTVARPRQAAGWRLAVTAEVPDLAALAPLLPDAPLPPLRDLALTATLADAGGGLPALSDLRLTLGAAALDALHPGLRLAGLTATLPAADQPLAFTAEGTAGALALKAGGSLGAPALWLAGTPWPLEVTLAAGEATASLRGTIADTRKIAGVDLALAVRVPALALLSPLAGAPLPAVRDLVFETRIAERTPRFEGGAVLRGLRLASSAADAAGDLTLIIGERPGVSGTLASTRIDLDALGPPAAAQPAAAAAAAAPGARPAPRDGRVIPDLPLPLEALRLVDSDLRWTIGTLTAGGVPVTDVAATLAIAAGRARLDPLTATLPGGRVSLRAAADVTTTPPTVQAAGISEGIDLPALLAALQAPQGTTGRLEFDIDLRGQGRDLRALAATAQGHAGFGLTSATVDGRSDSVLGRALADLRGALPALGTLAEGKVALACGAGRFDVARGIATTKALLFDGTLGKIGGTGSANLRDETLDMRLMLDLHLPVPGVSLLRIRAPVPLGGTFAAPRADYGAATVGGALGTAEGLLRTPSNLADGLLGILGAPAGSVPGAGGGLPDCGAALTAARGGRAGPVPASLAPVVVPGGAPGGVPGGAPVAPSAAPSGAPAAREGTPNLPSQAQDLLRGLFGR